MKRMLVLLLIGVMLISTAGFAAPKEMIVKDILKQVEVTEGVNEPSNGQNTVYVKFPKLGEFTVFTVDRIREINNLPNTVADYIDGSTLNGYEGEYTVTVDENGKEWVELYFWYTRANVDPYIINVEMKDENKNFTYAFTYDSSKTMKSKIEKEMKDISDKLVFSEIAIEGKTGYKEVTLVFPKMGSKLTKLYITRERTGSLSTTYVDYMNGDNDLWWEGDYSITPDLDGNEFVTVKFSYKTGNIDEFIINIRTVAGYSGVSFGCDCKYAPTN